ncbi:hypothetical protein SAMN04488156_102316 [Bacillus sp. 166amftsu]|nr:hypothetical protein SAMN04488156_102316 [Bacillus sp. 166amftsu]
MNKHVLPILPYGFNGLTSFIDEETIIDVLNVYQTSLM